MNWLQLKVKASTNEQCGSGPNEAYTGRWVLSLDANKSISGFILKLSQIVLNRTGAIIHSVLSFKKRDAISASVFRTPGQEGNT